MPEPDTATEDPGVLQIPGSSEPTVSTETDTGQPGMIALPAPTRIEDADSVTTDTVDEPTPELDARAAHPQDQ